MSPSFLKLKDSSKGLNQDKEKMLWHKQKQDKCQDRRLRGKKENEKSRLILDLKIKNKVNQLTYTCARGMGIRHSGKLKLSPK